jgi:hypothetical protein
MFATSGFRHPKMFQCYRKHLVQKAVCYMDSLGKDIELKINVLYAIHFTLVVWQQVTQSTVVSAPMGMNVTEKVTCTVLKERMMYSTRLDLAWD